MNEGVFEDEKKSKTVIGAYICLLFFCGVFFAWCFAIGLLGATLCYSTTATILFLILYIYISQSESVCLRRKLMDQQLSVLKETYLTLNEDQTSQKRVLEEMIHSIAINQNIHPWVNPKYTPQIKTTIDLSGNKMFTSYRDVQRQMRIDVMFNTATFDDRIVRDLISTSND